MSARNPDILSADEAAAWLGVDRKTLYDGARRGDVPCGRLGRRLIFHRTALLVWLGAQGRAAPGGNDASST